MRSAVKRPLHAIKNPACKRAAAVGLSAGDNLMPMAAASPAASVSGAFLCARRHLVRYFYHLAGFGVKFIGTAIICLHTGIIQKTTHTLGYASPKKQDYNRIDCSLVLVSACTCSMACCSCCRVKSVLWLKEFISCSMVFK